MHRFLQLALTLLLAAAMVGCETSGSGESNDSNPPESAETSKSEPEKAEASPSDISAEKAADVHQSGKTESKDVAEPEVVLELPNKATPVDGLVTSAQPTREQFDALDEAGITHVVNLRTAEEDGVWDEAAKAEQMGLGYTHVPIAGPEDLTRENVEALDRAIADADGKVLVHCSSSNRVGALLALRAFWIEGTSVERALELGRKAGMDSLGEAVREKLR
jgi:uncharacterized protein (TIGR01244 family)